MRKGTKADTVTQAFVEEVCGLLKDGKPVRRELPFGGRLHIERQLPFLCVYRDPVGRLDLSTERMISGEAAHLITLRTLSSFPKCPVHPQQHLQVVLLVYLLVLLSCRSCRNVPTELRERVHPSGSLPDILRRD